MKRIRKSIDQMLAVSNQSPDSSGLKCPRCHCVQFSQEGAVRNTIQVDDGIRRYRICRSCGLTFRTIERRG